MKKDSLKLLFCAFVYLVWSYRNGIVFQGQSFNRQRLLLSIWQDTRTKIAATTYKEIRSPECTRMEQTWQLNFKLLMPRTKWCQWKKPPLEWYAINSDGTVSDDGTTGWGAVIRRNNGEPVAAAHRSSSYKNINLVEVNEMEEVLKMVVEKGCDRIVVQCDYECNQVRKGHWDTMGD